MRELDAILTRFFESAAADLDPGEISQFAALLDLPDPELYGYLLGGHEPADADACRLVERIRGTFGPSA
jgi:succinate dehydrogenase flavin-adding protein (antitoxin of CptAB toxin-antitoxin module)